MRNRIGALVNGVLGKYGLEMRSLGGQNKVAVEATDVDLSIMSSCRPYTMTSDERLWALIQAVRYVNLNRIPGVLVECGVWRGGSAMAMALTSMSTGDIDRQIWLYDTFKGMTSPTDSDVELHTGRSASELLKGTPPTPGNNVWAIASLEDVKTNLASTNYPTSRIKYKVGDVAKTLLQDLPSEVAVLRLDTDWFESTRFELQRLYPNLVRGGVIIVDDYGHWGGARRAVDLYLSEIGSRPLIHRIDYSGRLWVKGV